MTTRFRPLGFCVGLVACLGLHFFGLAAPAAELGKAPDLDKAVWIWWSEDGLTSAGRLSYFRRKFELAAKPVEATIALTADNGYELFVNNRRIAGELGYGGDVWQSVERFRIEADLHAGANVIAVQGENLGGPGGVLAAVCVTLEDGSDVSFATDDQWLATPEAEGNWTEPDHDDSLWRPAVVLCEHGGGVWGRLSIPNHITDPAKLVVDRSVPGSAPPPAPDRFTEPDEGFRWPAGIVFVAGRAPLHSTNAQTTKWPIHGSQAFFEYDTPAPAFSGHKLYVMRPASPGAAPKLLVDAGRGLIACPSCSYDGEEILFAMAPEGEKHYKLFRIGADGTGLARLTTGPWHDYDPAELPDGRIVFASSRTGSRDEYHGNTARSLFCLSADRTEITPLTYHIVADSQPVVTADGRIAFVRHDNFMERAKVETHVHCIHPDGSAGEVIIGPDRDKISYDRPTGAEDSYRWLRNYGYACPAPLADGRVACLSHLGPVITGTESGGSANVPMPSDVALFDVAPLPDGRLLGSTIRGVLVVVDPNTGQAVKVLESETHDLHSVAYLGPTIRPSTMPTQVAAQAGRPHEKTGYLLCQSIFDTKQIDGDWERVKAVRIFSGKALCVRSAHHQYCHIGVEGVELGTVPLAPDGSFYVRVPADRALAIQAVDAEGRAVVNELSWIYVRPGERRSCTGCHNHRESTPSVEPPLAALGRPVDLLGRGSPHRFRANNAANGGVLNLQFDRFREAASINLYAPISRAKQMKTLQVQLQGSEAGRRRSAAARLAILRDSSAVPFLVDALGDEEASVRTEVALALAACGNREAVPALLDALRDATPEVAQAAHLALEHLTGHSQPFNPYRGQAPQNEEAEAWKRWIEGHDWHEIERGLSERVFSADPVESQLAIEALGHVGGDAGAGALREYLQSGRSDSLTARLAAIRALGHLRDASAVPLLARILDENVVPHPVQPRKSHEFGWAAAPDHLAGAAAEALGRIGTPEAEDRLIKAFDKLADFWYYTFRTADHTWLMGCHSSIPHWRIMEGLDAIGSEKVGHLTAKLLKSVPMDPDRGLLMENDDYESVTAGLIHRNGMTDRVVETCLATLGDSEAKPAPELTDAVTASPPAVSVGILSPESRAAHLLSVVCLGASDAPRVRAAFERYRAGPPSRKRSWTCFFLARTLGKLGDPGSVAVLRSALDDDPTEAEHGIPDPPNVFLHNAITPLYRAAAADALGRIGASEAVPSLLAAVADLDNAMDVRQAAADSLRRIAEPTSLPRLEALAEGYPEIATQFTLWEACAAARSNAAEGRQAGSR
ncbi:MAG: HEAT repeat domain-containing protein [Planctomycetota bacterium]|jgi:HEAT repeat protein